MNPRIESLREKKLIGKKTIMSFSDYTIGNLWKLFLSEKSAITNNVSRDMISMSIYKPNFFTNFNPFAEFEKWAAVEVLDFDIVPSGMNIFVLPAGFYAVFEYKGLSSDNSIFEYIFNVWLPESGYALDNRPHFEILGEKYKNNDSDSEEEIWIPIKIKS